MHSDTLIEKIKMSFDAIELNKESLGSHTSSFRISSYPPMRNKDRGFDINIIVECKGLDFEHVSDIIATNARFKFLLALSNCQYSYEQGLYWTEKLGAYKVVNDFFNPNVILSNKGADLNSNRSGNSLKRGLSLDSDTEVRTHVSNKLISLLTEAGREEVFNVMLARARTQTIKNVAS